MACWLTIAKVSVPHQLTPLLWACGKHITVEQTTRLVPQMPKKRGWDPSLPVGFKGASPDGTLPSRPVLSFRYLPIVSGEQAFSTWASWGTLQSQTIAVRAAIWELSVKLSGPPRPSLNVISRGPVSLHSACRVRWPMHQTPSTPPHNLSHHSGAPKSSICDLPDLTSAWERGTWETDADVYVIDAQIIFLQICLGALSHVLLCSLAAIACFPSVQTSNLALAYPEELPHGIMLRRGGGRSSTGWPLSMLSSPSNLRTPLTVLIWKYLGFLMRCFQFKSRC